MTDIKELSFRHQIFCYKFIETQNATEAYLLAGYKVSREVARRNGARLLTNADIFSFIFNIQTKLIKASDVNLERIVYELSNIAFSNSIGDVVYVKDGEFQIRDDARFQGISFIAQKYTSIDKSIFKTFIIKSEDRIKALELLSRMLGLLNQ